MENFLCCRSRVRHYLIEYSIEFSVWSLYQPSFRNGSESVGDSLKDTQLRKDTTEFKSTYTYVLFVPGSPGLPDWGG